MILNCTQYYNKVKQFSFKRRFEWRIQNLVTHAFKKVVDMET